MAAKKTVMSKSISQGELEWMYQKKTQKRASRASQNESDEDDDIISGLIEKYQLIAKKKKTEVRSGTNPESLIMILDSVGNQLEERKQCNENFSKSLKAITTRIEADYITMKENERQFKYLTETFMKCTQQASAAYKHKLKGLKDIQTSFEKEYEKMETGHKIDTEKLVNELECDIKKMQEKIVDDTKRSSWESMRRRIFDAMQNDL